jgi:hypothetical protein
MVMLLERPSNDGNRRAFRREPLRNRRADTTRRTGDQHAFHENISSAVDQM